MKVAVTPAGNPTADKDTAEEKPPVMLEVTVADPLLPRTMLTPEGTGAREKSAELGVLMV